MPLAENVYDFHFKMLTAISFGLKRDQTLEARHLCPKFVQKKYVNCKLTD